MKMTKQESLYQELCLRISRLLAASLRRLPTEKAMCESFGVSRQTLRIVLSRLKAEGVITSIQGSGYSLTGLHPGGGNRIVLLLPDNEAYLFPSLISEVTACFDRLHYEVSVIITHYARAAERDTLLRLVKDPPRGLILQCIESAVPTENDDLFEELARRGTKLVFIGSRYPNLSCGLIAAFDEVSGAMSLTRHLLKLGHRNIGCLLYENDLVAFSRYLGYARVLAEDNIPLRKDNVGWIPEEASFRTQRSANKAIHVCLSAMSRDVTALICQNDAVSDTAVRVLDRRGLKVPDDMSVAGFDNSYLCSYGPLLLTTMAPAPESAAQYVCRVMRGFLQTGETNIPGEIPGWKLVRGTSTMRLE